MSFRAILVMAAMLMSVASPAGAQQAGPGDPIQIVTYVEIRPSAIDHARAAMRAYREGTRAEAGLVRLAVLAEDGRADRFVIQETWANFGAYDGHGKGPSASRFAETIRDDLLAPLDIRVHQNWGRPNPIAPLAPFVVMTHLQVGPPRVEELAAALAPLVERSRTEEGMLEFDVLQQVTPRRNNMTLVEGWASPEAALRHAEDPATRLFRRQLGPLLGALFDQRRYRPLR